MSQVYLALYKGKKEGRGLKAFGNRLLDCAIRIITRSPYSHCEIAIKEHPESSEFLCFSSSARDGGVRRKVMPLPNDKWDFIELPYTVIEPTLRLFRRTHGLGYDWPGAIGTVLKLSHLQNKWFCSEWCARALKLPEPQNYTPAGLAKAVKGLK